MQVNRLFIPEDTREKIAALIADRRKHLNISQDKLAELSGFHVSTIRRIESCKFSPTTEVFLTICKVLELSIAIEPMDPTSDGNFLQLTPSGKKFY